MLQTAACITNTHPGAGWSFMADNGRKMATVTVSGSSPNTVPLTGYIWVFATSLPVCRVKTSALSILALFISLTTVTMTTVYYVTGNSIVMTIRDGVTSTSPIINHINTTSMENDTLTLEALSGFYMRLQGSYTVSDYIDMTFTAFSLPHKGQLFRGTRAWMRFHVPRCMWHNIDKLWIIPDGSCHKSSEFKCRSRHCIDRHLVCDGHNHCEDGVDEQEHCRSASIRNYQTTRHLLDSANRAI